MTQSLDVIYINGESVKEDKLLSPDNKLCFTLPQIEASAKTAKYYSNGIMWSSGLNHATLTLGDEHYDFIEKPIVKKDTIKSASHATSKTKQKITSH